MNIGFAAAFLGGIAAIFSPCSAMLLPSFFAMAFGARVRTLMGRVGIFYLGSLLTLVPMGLAAGTLGRILAEHRQTLTLVGGVALIVIGVFIALGFTIPIPGLRAKGGSSPLSVLVLGMVYGLAGTCTGPLLGAILTMAAMSSSPLYGAFLLAIFAAGMAVPLAVLALLWDKIDVAGRFQPKEINFGPGNHHQVGANFGSHFRCVGPSVPIHRRHRRTRWHPRRRFSAQARNIAQ